MESFGKPCTTLHRSSTFNRYSVSGTGRRRAFAGGWVDPEQLPTPRPSAVDLRAVRRVPLEGRAALPLRFVCRLKLRPTAGPAEPFEPDSPGGDLPCVVQSPARGDIPRGPVRRIGKRGGASSSSPPRSVPQGNRELGSPPARGRGRDRSRRSQESHTSRWARGEKNVSWARGCRGGRPKKRAARGRCYGAARFGGLPRAGGGGTGSRVRA